MADLDASRYVDLAPFDVDAQALIGQALSDAASKLPGWVPREGNTELVILEAQALVVAELIFAVNRLPGALMEGVLGVYGLQRDAGRAPTVRLRLTSATAVAATVRKGTRVRVLYDGGEAFADFTTTADVVVPARGSATVAAVGEQRSAAVNGRGPGTAVELVDNVAAVESVALADVVTGGVDAEDGPALLDRGVAALRRLSSVLVLPGQFTAAALATAGIARALTLDLFDAGRGGAPGSHPGHVSVAVIAPGGTLVPAADRAALRKALGEQAMAALNVHVVPITVTALDVGVTVAARPGFASAGVVGAVQRSVEALLDPDTWPVGTTVYRNQILAAADRAEGVARVVDVTAPAGDVVLPGVAGLPRPGLVTVTVVPA